ncbi:unnamed protein product [Cuscuta campestris]|uniref:Uncharacterized protein n=1 Tax=Cuscuta campestris TaxID=132261 RepID=A0A484MNH9_9ASTE|nr:unnamed protein product [Cuscuta campestris]
MNHLNSFGSSTCEILKLGRPKELGLVNLSNANVGTGVPQQGENSATGGRHPPITTGEAEALIQRVGITAEQFKEVLAALAPNREVVVGDVAGGPTGEKAGPAAQGKKKKSDLRDTLKEKRGESTATSKVGSEERRTTVGDKGAAELWKMYEQLEKRLDAQNPYRQAVFSEIKESATPSYISSSMPSGIGSRFICLITYGQQKGKQRYPLSIDAEWYSIAAQE